MPNSRILNLSQIRNALKDAQLYKVAKIAGVTYPTLSKMLNDPDANPTYKTLSAVSGYILNSSRMRS